MIPATPPARQAAALPRWLAPLRALRGTWPALLDFPLPQRCPGCGCAAEAARVLCESCRARIPRLTAPLCVRCLLDGGDPSACVRHATRRVFAPWVNDERASALVHALKYGARPGVARSVAAELAAAVPGPWRGADLVLAVPLHPARERERGYNQAAHLAEALAGALAMPRLDGALRRRRGTRAQARLGRFARAGNVADAFAVVNPERLAGRRVLVVDDVMTTGATMNECLVTLERAGAKAAGVVLAWTQ